MTLSRRSLLVGMAAGLGAASLAVTAQAAQAAPADLFPEQPDWAWCNACNGLFYTDNLTYGYCAYGLITGQETTLHASYNHYTSDYYKVSYSAAGTDYQPNWLWCQNCQGLFWAPAGKLTAGTCPDRLNGPAPHDGSGSNPYVVYDGTASIGQPGWRWCKNCSGLFHTGTGAIRGLPDGICPSGNNGIILQHDGSGSYPYQLVRSGTRDF